MTTIHRDWQVAHAALTHAALTHAADVVTREPEQASAAQRHGVAMVLHDMATRLLTEAIGVIGQPSTREVLP